MIDRLPPQSLEAEQSVLGAILIDRDAVIPLQQRLAQQELARQAGKAVLHALRCVGDGIAWKTLLEGNTLTYWQQDEAGRWVKKA